MKIKKTLALIFGALFKPEVKHSKDSASKITNGTILSRKLLIDDIRNLMHFMTVRQVIL